MSQSERERALVTQWRNTAKRYDFPTKSLEDATYSATLDRCADELAAALDTPQEPTPAAPPGLEKFLSELEVEAGDYNRRFEESTKRQEYITAAQQGGVAAAYRNVVVRLRALAAAPRPALSPDAIERMVGKIGQRCVRGHDLFDGAACKEILIEAFRASAPREGA